MGKNLPHRFHASVTRQRHGHNLVAVEGRPTILGGAPPEFGGSAEVWSPEHMLVGSVALCFVATLEYLAQREALEMPALHCEGTGTVDKTASGLAFTALRLAVRLTVRPGMTAKAVELIDKAKRGCLVSASVKAPVELTFDVIEDSRVTRPSTPPLPASGTPVVT